MQKVTMLRGLPASGKTTWAKKQTAKRVNKDDLRAMLDNSKWSKCNEKFVLKIRDIIIQEALSYGHDVIVDDTNLHPKHERDIRELVLEYNELLKKDVKFEIMEFDTDLTACIKRDGKRANPIGSKVIYDMYNRYLKPEPKKVSHVQDAHRAIICDIDGTLATKGDRDIYDGSKCYLDTVAEPIASLIDRYAATHKIIMLSGRDSEYREVTEQWLKDNNICYHALYMRAEGDKRCDSIVKKELYENHIKGEYNVEFVLDDRKRVKRMWVQEGLFVLDVNQYDEEF